MTNHPLKFMPNWYMMFKSRDTDAKKLAFVKTILEYMFESKVPECAYKDPGEFESGVEYAVYDAFWTAKPLIEANLREVAAGVYGSKGGAPKGNKNATKNNQNNPGVELENNPPVVSKNNPPLSMNKNMNNELRSKNIESLPPTPQGSEREYSYEVVFNSSKSNKAIPDKDRESFIKYVIDHHLLDDGRKIDRLSVYLTPLYRKWKQQGLDKPDKVHRITKDELKAVITQMNEIRIKKLPNECFAKVWDWLCDKGFEDYHGNMITSKNAMSSIGWWFDNVYSTSEEAKQKKEDDAEAERIRQEERINKRLLQEDGADD